MGCQFVRNTPIDTQEIVITKKGKNNQVLNDIEKILLSTSLLNEFNLARTNPEQYGKKIEEYKLRVSYNATMKSYYLQANDHIEIAMNTGIDAIEKCCDFLRKQKQLKALKFSEALCLNKITITAENEINNSKSKMFPEIRKTILSQIKEAEFQYNIQSFHYDKTTPNGEISAFCQIVDDTSSNCIRRKNIFNPNVTHVGITCRNVSKGVVCFYIIFGSLKVNISNL